MFFPACKAASPLQLPGCQMSFSCCHSTEVLTAQVKSREDLKYKEKQTSKPPLLKCFARFQVCGSPRMQQEIEHCKCFHGVRVSWDGPQLPWLYLCSLAAQLFYEMFWISTRLSLELS